MKGFPIIQCTHQTSAFTPPLLLSLLLGCLLLLEPVHSFHHANNHPNNKAVRSNSMSDSEGQPQQPLSVGFVGCGTIAASIARGLLRADSLELESMVVSQRSESKSRALREEYDQVRIQSNNQNILDECDVIFLTVLPQQASEVLRGLEFDPDRHILVSLLSTANLEDLVKDSGLSPARVSKMICLPSIANHQGVALLCCAEPGGTTQALLQKVFTATGGVVCLDTEADLEACMVTTCTMGPLYGTMLKQRDWLLQNTDSLSATDATFLVVQQFAGAVLDATTDIHERRLEDLIEEQTPGGLNEQALNNYGTVLNGFEDLQQPVMDAILSRIRGDTDGSVTPK